MSEWVIQLRALTAFSSSIFLYYNPPTHPPTYLKVLISRFMSREVMQLRVELSH